MRLKKLSRIYSYLKQQQPEDLSNTQRQLLSELESLHNYLYHKGTRTLAQRLLKEDALNKDSSKPILEVIIGPPPTQCPTCGRPW